MLELPSGQIEPKNNEPVCSGENKQVRCGHDRLPLSTFIQDVERADAGGK